MNKVVLSIPRVLLLLVCVVLSVTWCRFWKFVKFWVVLYTTTGVAPNISPLTSNGSASPYHLEPAGPGAHEAVLCDEHLFQESQRGCREQNQVMGQAVSMSSLDHLCLRNPALQDLKWADVHGSGPLTVPNIPPPTHYAE